MELAEGAARVRRVLRTFSKDPVLRQWQLSATTRSPDQSGDALPARPWLALDQKHKHVTQMLAYAPLPSSPTRPAGQPQRWPLTRKERGP
jgi:hypothetical protein